MKNASSKLVLALAAGDPRGVGPEVTVRAVAEVLRRRDDLAFTIFGCERQLSRLFSEAGVTGAVAATSVTIEDVPHIAAGPELTAESSGRAALEALNRACDLVDAGQADALVTAPLSKEAVALSRPGFVGHTGYLGSRYGRETLMMLASDSMRVFLTTDHVPIADVSRLMTAERLRFTCEVARDYLRRDCGLAAPRLAVLGLNPHAGEGGEIGREEQDVIIPTLRGLGGEGAGLFGPLSADSFFVPERCDAFDGIVAQFHDQGLVPLKARGFGDAVNVTLGLPIVRTSPDHGTAFDIAGQGRADFRSMVRAIVTAARSATLSPSAPKI